MIRDAKCLYGKAYNYEDSIKLNNLYAELRDNNKLIAEFIGLEYAPKDKRWDDWFDKNGTRITYGIRIPLQYDTSWDWLMPVIKKCLVGEAEQSEEMSNTTIKNVYEGICNQDISFAYKSVVEFINQHNKI
tara:strand:+ start:41 stop:433 length:393 start_codon:yes stop_codon:yes gene_type:complete